MSNKKDSISVELNKAVQEAEKHNRWFSNSNILNALSYWKNKLNKNVLLDLIRYYTREAGVRGLERQISKILRKVVKERLLAKRKTATKINSKNLEKYSGVRKFKFGEAESSNTIGQVCGLAWTEVGGELLTIEASKVSGKGKTIKTGSLGCLLYTSPSPRDCLLSRMPSSA